MTESEEVIASNGLAILVKPGRWIIRIILREMGGQYCGIEWT